MSEIPTLSQYDSKRAKVRCSIQWILSEAYTSRNFPKHLPHRDIEHIFESDGGLKISISALLCRGDAYCRLTGRMFNLVEPLQSHEDVIQVLCSKGLYVLDDADSLITANDLRKMPLALSHHLIIIDMLMFAHVSLNLAPINSLVLTVKKFSQFSASRELPDNLEEAFILWLNKVSRKVHTNHRVALESDKHTFEQQREDDCIFPTITNLTEDLYDGRSLALLLHYYCPGHVALRDISLVDPTSMADAWHNLQLCLNFCNDFLLPTDSPWMDGILPTVLHPADILYCSQEMKMNMMVFCGKLFYYLETEALQDVVFPLGHSVLCKRQRVISSEDVVSSSEPQRSLTFMTMDERHQQTMVQASQLVPGVQPLISNATKRSFVKNNSTDTDSLSTITCNQSEGRISPPPFSSRPLLVRRNRDPQPSQLSATSNYHPRTLADHLPLVKSHRRADCNYMSDEDDHARTQLHPLRKSSSYQGLTNGESVVSERPKPVVNKWHLKTPVQDFRNTNTSNNALLNEYGGFDSQGHSPRSLGYTTESGSSKLLSNVEMDSDGDIQNGKGQMESGDGTVTSSQLSWSTATFGTTPVGARNANDLALETARTADFLSARPHLHSQNDLFDARRIPAVVSTKESPDLPRNVTHVTPYYKHHTEVGSLSVSGPSSQKSYTVQNGEFQTLDSARAAGYPIISPDRQRHTQPMRVPHNEGLHILSQMNTQPSRNGKDAADSSTPHVKECSRPMRNVWTTSWVEIALKKKETDRIAEEQLRIAREQRKHRKSTRPSMDKSRVENFLKDLEEKRRLIEERKRMQEMGRKIKFAKFLRELDNSNSGASNQDEAGRNTNVTNHRSTQTTTAPKKNEDTSSEYSSKSPSPSMTNHRSTQTFHCITHTTIAPNKNEDTSSDYSSKSPSPSSMDNQNFEKTESDKRGVRQFGKPETDHNQNIERTASDKRGSRQFGKLERDVSSLSDDRNFFASPLSTTTYLVNRQDQTDGNLAHSYNSTIPSRPVGKTYISDQQQQTSQTNPKSDQSGSVSQEKTYNVSRRYPETQHNRISRQQRELSGGENEISHSHKDLRSNTLSSQNHTPPSKFGHQGPIQGAQMGEYQHEQVPYNALQEKENRDAMCHADRGQNGVHNEGHSYKHGWEARQMTYDVSGHAAGDGSKVPHISSQSATQESARESPKIVQKPPEINILQPLSSEQSTRRNLFSGGGAQDPDTSTEQENIDPNHLNAGHADQTTYDCFSNKIAGVGSNQSTPHKSPRQELELVTPVKGDDASEMSSVLLKTADKDRKGGKGFELLDETMPIVDVAKKKEQFLLKQLKKEDVLKRRRADREMQEEKRKEEARQKQEEIAAKKEEDKLKRQQILEEYKKKKMRLEEARLNQQSSAIIAGGSGKKHFKPETNPHPGKINKVSKSGRSSPAPDVTNQPTFDVSAGSDEGASCTNARPFRTRKLSTGGRKDWDAESATSSAVSSEYTGPKLYKQPSSKSNKHIVHNAICHCCLPGKVNEALRNTTIQVLEISDARHFMILFRAAKCQYRALYSYDPEEEKLHKLCGNGPIIIVPSMIEQLFKYNSGRKSFTSLSSKTLSVSIEAITIKNSHWQTSKK